MCAACRRIVSPGEFDLHPKHVSRIVCGVCLAGFTLVLAGGGGGGRGSRRFVFKPLPFVTNTYLTTSPEFPYSGQLYATSPQGLTISYGLDTPPAHGTVTINSNTGTYVYTPDNGYTGTDSFTYTAATPNGTSPKATAAIVVNGGAPEVSAYGAPVYVHNGTPGSVNVEVRLSNPPNGQATVNYATVDGTAKAGVDYTAQSGTLTFGPGVTEHTITIPLSDQQGTTYKFFRVRLSNPSSTLAMGVATANVVLRYWPEPLNDTGMGGCATETNGNPVNPISCPQTGYPNQDGDLGRDRQSYENKLVKVGYGGYTYNFGFDFTKIAFDGTPLFNQAASYSTDPWACARDNWTGLEWEVPTEGSDAGLFSASYIYTWYDPDSNTNGGNAGQAKGGPYKMDTYHFVQMANQVNLCGHSDWRLPTASELRNLLNVSAGALGLFAASGIPSIPTLESGGYWTATSDPIYRDRAVVISSQQDYDSFLPKDGSTGIGGGYFAILVRGGVQ